MREGGRQAGRQSVREWPEGKARASKLVEVKGEGGRLIGLCLS